MLLARHIKEIIFLHIVKPIRSLQYKRLINYKFKSAKNNNLKYLVEKGELENWKSSFNDLLCSEKSAVNILNGFTDSHIELIKNTSHENKGPILISVVKNEINRIKPFITHYRELGVQHFAILDNNSDDGTREWLCQQEDCAVFSTKEAYTTQKRESWINRLLSHYGFNKWYLVVDSDEHFVYPNVENIKINDFINVMTKMGYKRVRSLMLDMYPKDFIQGVENDDNPFDYVLKYNYFDKNNYTIIDNGRGIMVNGGPRKRLFNVDVYLTKYPLFYLTDGDIQGHSHYQYPYKENRKIPCFSALLHYKFLGNDLKKYEQRVKEKSFYNGSEEYEKYLELFNSKEKFTFYHESSLEYKGSASLLEVDIIKDWKQ
ncbi:glycosyltransferase family 2 protein [Priestia flexa]|uniref:glycosyltransferase family 2 protein n=1 Tax=Priestia flexa TaxID=86664 RepID=UPI0004742204|nr:glycosyltransferase family 2 protein [Priestia flexa]